MGPFEVDHAGELIVPGDNPELPKGMYWIAFVIEGGSLMLGHVSAAESRGPRCIFDGTPDAWPSMLPNEPASCSDLVSRTNVFAVVRVPGEASVPTPGMDGGSPIGGTPDTFGHAVPFSGETMIDQPNEAHLVPVSLDRPGTLVGLSALSRRAGGLEQNNTASPYVASAMGGRRWGSK